MHNQTASVRMSKPLLGVFVTVMVFALLGVSVAPAARAEQGWTETPTSLPVGTETPNPTRTTLPTQPPTLFEMPSQVFTPDNLQSAIPALAWVSVDTANHPPVHSDYAMAYDSGVQKTILFGGTDGSGCFGET